MIMIPKDELPEHVQCFEWLKVEYPAAIEGYLSEGADISIVTYIKIMHPEVYVAWRMVR